MQIIIRNEVTAEKAEIIKDIEGIKSNSKLLEFLIDTYHEKIKIENEQKKSPAI